MGADGFAVQPTLLVGRREEIVAASRFVRNGARLLTLTGPPGVGKTRLALSLLDEWSASYRDGARLVDLSTAADAHDVPPLLAHTFCVPGPSQLAPLERLMRHIATKRVLMLLDNFEHVFGAASDIASVLARCPGVAILVTSRSPLHLRGERVLDVRPLPLPPSDPVPSLDELARVPSIELFVARARAVDVRFVLTEANAPMIAKLVARLDGLPLAIELAAAQARVLSPQDVLVRLERRLPLPRISHVDAPPRHQTLGAAIAWSYDRLSGAEQAVFRQIGVLRKPWTVAAATAVLTPSLRAEAPRHLRALLFASLVRRGESRDGEQRFFLMDTIRDFALSRLADGELHAAQRRHARYFARVPKRSMVEIHGLVGARQQRALMHLDEQYDNFYTALRWASERREFATALRLAQRLILIWWQRGQVRGAQNELEQLLVGCGDAPVRLQVDIMLSCAAFAGWLGDLPRAIELGRAGLRLARAQHDRRSTARALTRLGEVLVATGRSGLAVRLLKRALALWRTIGHPWSTGFTLRTLSAALAPFDADRAYAAGEDAVKVFKAIGDLRNLAVALSQLASLAYARRNYCEAQRLLRTAVMTALECHDTQALSCALGWIVAVTASVAPCESTARLIASLKKSRDSGHRSWKDARLQTRLEEADALLPSRVRLAAVPASSLEHLINDALRCVGSLTAAPPAIPNPRAAGQRPWDNLTPRQREVLSLIAAGLASKQIARTLSISDATVKYHVTSIFNKLGVDNRSGAVNLAVHEELVALPGDGFALDNGLRPRWSPRPDRRVEAHN